MPATLHPVYSRHGEYSLLRLALPGRPEHAIGVLLRDPDEDRLFLRLRSDWEEIAGEEDLEYLSHLEEHLRAQAAEMGADRFLLGLEDSLSHAIRIEDREAVPLNSFHYMLDRLFARHVAAPEIQPYRTHLPIYSLRAAATKFGEDMQVDEEDWVTIPEDLRASENLFVAHVAGRS